MSAEQPQSGPSFWQRLVRFIIRLLFVFVVGIALGAGIFFGAVFLYQQYVQPVQSNSTTLKVFEIRLEQVEGERTVATHQFRQIRRRHVGRRSALHFRLGHRCALPRRPFVT